MCPHGTAECVVTALETGIGGNINQPVVFSIWPESRNYETRCRGLNGYDRETDALICKETIQEKDPVLKQWRPVAAPKLRTEKYYSAARMTINKSTAGSDYPVPLPGRGYNLVVRTPTPERVQRQKYRKNFCRFCLAPVRVRKLSERRHVDAPGLGWDGVHYRDAAEYFYP